MDSSVYSYIQLTLTADIENYQDMCMGLRKKYITDSIMDDDINLILVVYKKTAATSRVIGLALVQLYDAKFEIDVLCGSTEIKGLGTYLIQLVKEIGLRYDKTELTLSSVTEALGFYTKQGFECDSLCPMKLEIADALKGGKRKFTRRRKYTKRKRSKSKKRT
jgi:hypothetical protein